VFTTLLSRWYREGTGQDLLEYALIGAFISIAVLTGASRLGFSVNGWFVAVSEVAAEARSEDDGNDEDSGDPGGNGSNCGAQGMASSSGKCNGG
jgi:Flp pilus assembly pilin Flp